MKNGTENKKLKSLELSFLWYWWIALILASPPVIFLFNKPELVFGGRMPLLMAWVDGVYIVSLFAIFFIGRALAKHIRNN